LEAGTIVCEKAAERFAVPGKLITFDTTITSTAKQDF
jgi:hypothetical protein